jgi:hypothetical protein
VSNFEARGVVETKVAELTPVFLGHLCRIDAQLLGNLTKSALPVF